MVILTIAVHSQATIVLRSVITLLHASVFLLLLFLLMACSLKIWSDQRFLCIKNDQTPKSCIQSLLLQIFRGYAEKFMQRLTIIYQPGYLILRSRNQALRPCFQNSRCGGILIQNRNQDHLLSTIVFDCMVYPHPKKYQKIWVRVNNTIGNNQKTKKWPLFF